MARTNIYVTFGYVVLILTILAGIGVAIYYVVKGFISRTVSIENVSIQRPLGGLEIGYLKFSIKLNGECIKDCTPKLTNVNMEGYMPKNLVFNSLVNTGAGSWDASVAITNPWVFTQNSVTTAISVTIGSDIGGFYGSVVVD